MNSREVTCKGSSVGHANKHKTTKVACAHRLQRESDQASFDLNKCSKIHSRGVGHIDAMLGRIPLATRKHYVKRTRKNISWPRQPTRRWVVWISLGFKENK